MREIKFRFWDKSRQKFTDYGAIHKDGDLMARSETFGGLYDFADEEMEENVIIQQYIGLKDRSGAEIYEGDIIKIDDPHVETCGEVVYWIESGRYFATFGIMGSGSFTNVMAYGNGRTLEVIGNIYEHGHLLENESKE